MPRILAAASALPPYNYSQDEIRNAVGRLFSGRLPELQRLLSVFDHSRIDLRHYVTHPGGARVVDAYRESLGLVGEELMLTEAALHDHGNVSSVSVLLVLEQWLAGRGPQIPGPGLISAFGPGFSAEMLLQTGDW